MKKHFLYLLTLVFASAFTHAAWNPKWISVNIPEKVVAIGSGNETTVEVEFQNAKPGPHTEVKISVRDTDISKTVKVGNLSEPKFSTGIDISRSPLGLYIFDVAIGNALLRTDVAHRSVIVQAIRNLSMEINEKNPTSGKDLEVLPNTEVQFSPIPQFRFFASLKSWPQGYPKYSFIQKPINSNVITPPNAAKTFNITFDKVGRYVLRAECGTSFYDQVIYVKNTGNFKLYGRPSLADDASFDRPRVVVGGIPGQVPSHEAADFKVEINDGLLYQEMELWVNDGRQRHKLSDFVPIASTVYFRNVDFAAYNTNSIIGGHQDINLSVYVKYKGHDIQSSVSLVIVDDSIHYHWKENEGATIVLRPDKDVVRKEDPKRFQREQTKLTDTIIMHEVKYIAANDYLQTGANRKRTTWIVGPPEFEPRWYAVGRNKISNTREAKNTAPMYFDTKDELQKFELVNTREEISDWKTVVEVRDLLRDLDTDAEFSLAVKTSTHITGSREVTNSTTATRSSETSWEIGGEIGVLSIGRTTTDNFGFSWTKTFAEKLEVTFGDEVEQSFTVAIPVVAEKGDSVRYQSSIAIEVKTFDIDHYRDINPRDAFPDNGLINEVVEARKALHPIIRVRVLKNDPNN